MIKFKQTVVTSAVRPEPSVTPRAPETSSLASAGSTRAKQKAAPTAPQNSETQLSVPFDEASPDKG